MLLWELREGFYIRAFSSEDGLFSDTLQFIPLDSKIPDSPPLSFDFTFNEFTTDPGQGLFAILSRSMQRDMSVHIHLRSSSTGLAHPLARHPLLTAVLDFEPPYVWPGFSIEIMGDMVLAKVSLPQTHMYELLVWNWKFGILLHRIGSRQGICDYAFLDQQHLVVLSGSPSIQSHLGTLALLIYAISENVSTHSYPLNTGQIRISDAPISQPILCLELPQIKQSCVLSETGFFLRSQPTPGRAMYTASATFACPYARTFSMTFSCHGSIDNWGSRAYYRVFVDGRFLLDQARTAPRNGTKVLPWFSWGERATRWLVAPEESDHWISWMSGSRFITSLPHHPYYCVFDFSRPIVSRFRDSFAQLHPVTPDQSNGFYTTEGAFQNLAHLGGDICQFSVNSPPNHEFFTITVGEDQPSIIEIDEYLGFQEPITSRLPFRLVFRTDKKRKHGGWQINGDCVLGITSGETSETITIYRLEMNEQTT
ncbi:hypothetical protein ACGC1H_002004 [Rhizoctonia solani]